MWSRGRRECSQRRLFRVTKCSLLLCLVLIVIRSCKVAFLGLTLRTESSTIVDTSLCGPSSQTDLFNACGITSCERWRVRCEQSQAKRHALPVDGLLARQMCAAGCGNGCQVTLYAGISGILVSMTLLLVFKFYETMVEKLEHDLPRCMLPVLNRTLAEMSGLGFLAVLLELLHIGGHGHGSLLTNLSLVFLGNKHILHDQFEFLHGTLFWVSLVFFAACGLITAHVIRKLRNIRVSVLPNKLLDLLRAEDPKVPLQAPSREQADFKDRRTRFMDMAESDGLILPRNFRFWAYLQEVAAVNLKQLVNLTPASLVFVWIPSIVLVNAANMITGATVHGATLQYLMGTLLWLPFLALHAGTLVWGVFNYFKLGHVKRMLGPDNSDMSPPRYLAGKQAVQEGWVKPNREKHERLFKIFGIGSSKFYLTSVKLLLFTNIANIVYCGRIAARDLFFLCNHGSVVSSSVSIEAVVFTLVVLKEIVLVSLTPFTFVRYVWVSATEAMRDDGALLRVLNAQSELRLRTTLRSLLVLCERLDWATRQLESPPSFPARSKVDTDRQWYGLVENVSADTLLDVHHMFVSHDADGDGRLTADELQELARDLGYSIEGNVLKAFVSSIDLNNDGIVSFSEFAVELLRMDCVPPERLEAVNLDDVLDRIVCVFDADSSGLISWTEFNDQLTRLGFDARGAQQLFTDMACGLRGSITRDQFRAYLKDCSESETSEVWSSQA